MKKILVVHNRYKFLGGEDIAVDNEIEILSKEITKGVKLLDFLADNKIMSSKNEARRAIKNKGLKIDNIVVTNENKILQTLDFKKGMTKLSYGKKKHYLIKVI